MRPLIESQEDSKLPHLRITHVLIAKPEKLLLGIESERAGGGW